MVLAATQRDKHVEVLVAPVTTRPPLPGDGGVEMPSAVRAHLGLDERCWVVTSELNRFIWPGPDIRVVRGKGELSPYYGKVPGKLLERVREGMKAHIKVGRMKVTKRSE